MALTQYLSCPQLTAPAAAASVTVTPNASSWANSAWVELIASTASAIVLTSVEVSVVGVAQPFEIDIGVGAVASEAVITTLRGRYVDLTYHGLDHMPLVIPLDNIPSASRVSIRMRKNSTSVVVWKFAITYLAKPITGSLLTTAVPTKCVPSAAASITLSTNATPWANSTYTTIIASAAADLVLVGVVARPTSSGVITEIDIAVGAAASEVIITTLRVLGGPTEGPHFIPLYCPLDAIPSGTRVSARNRRSANSGTPDIALVYLEKPL
jgi:hypothetical protein